MHYSKEIYQGVSEALGDRGFALDVMQVAERIEGAHDELSRCVPQIPSFQPDMLVALFTHLIERQIATEGGAS